MNEPLTFLLVDDDPDDTMLFTEVLEDINSTINLKKAANGREALDILMKETDSPDLIFLDLNMPKMDGKECLSALKQDARLSNIPVIIYTTSSHSADVEQTIQMGAVAFITKPSNIKELRMIIKSITENVKTDLTGTLAKLCNYPGTFIIC